MKSKSSLYCQYLLFQFSFLFSFRKLYITSRKIREVAGCFLIVLFYCLSHNSSRIKIRQFGWIAPSASEVRGTMFLLLSEVNRTFKTIFSRRILKIFYKQNYYFFTVEQNERILKDKLEVE